MGKLKSLRPAVATLPAAVGYGEDRRAKERQRRDAAPWQAWYSLAAWRGPNGRRAQQLRAEPLCWMCAERGIVTAATVADHAEPHRGDWERFWKGALRSLCGLCHSGAKQAQERGAGL